MNNKGFSILELITAVSIFFFIVAAMLFMLTSGKNSWHTQDIQSALYQNARKAMDEMTMELSESSRNTITIYAFIDPLNGESSEAICFASGRGDPAIAAEDGIHSNNDYVHWDAGGDISWRSAVVYCTYQTADGIKQLRRYVDYGPATNYYSGTAIFPLTITSIATNINILSGDGSVVSLNRNPAANMTILANYLGTEDVNNDSILNSNEDDGEASLPWDNADGILNTGANFIKASGLINIQLFFKREIRALATTGRFLINTLKGSVQLRQP
ncbi:MAG: hypothetical protein ABH952_10170 [Candidatus Omnitrophota bacterium]